MTRPSRTRIDHGRAERRCAARTSRGKRCRQRGIYPVGTLRVCAVHARRVVDGARIR
jgi:hypothetical protein